jgi:hypothetical protein
MSDIWNRFLKAMSDLRIVLAVLAFAYAAVYLTHEGMPGNRPGYPLGWWGWYDQGEYLKSADAFARHDLSPAKHYYPPLYPLLGSLFIHKMANHPFWLVNLASFLCFAAVFLLLASRYVSKPIAAVLFTLPVLLNNRIMENFVIPWTSTVSAALLSIGIYGLMRIASYDGKRSDNQRLPSILACFGISLALGLIAPLRPLDSLVGGIIWVGFLWMIWHRANYTGADRTQRVRRLFSACFIGILIGPAIFLGFNRLVYGSIFGGYIQATAANGYYPADLAEKCISIFLDGYTLYLEPHAGLIDKYPWLLLSFVGILFVLVRGDLVLRIVALAICAQFILYLPYGDLLPTSLWRYMNIHYFKWTFPYLALFTWLIVAFLAREWSPNKGKIAVWIGVIVASITLLLSLRVQVDFKPIASQTAAVSGAENARLFSFQLSADETDLVDVTGLQGGWQEDYFGEHKLWADGKELLKYRDFRVLPAPWGIRVLFIRPLRAASIVFQPDERLIRTGPEMSALAGTYHFILGVPKPFWDGENAFPSSRYVLGEVVDFTDHGNSSMYAQTGWSSPESWGRWTVGRKAIVRMRLDQHLSKPLLLEMELGAFVRPQHTVQRVAVYANNIFLGKQEFSLDRGADKPKRMTLELPINAVRDDGELRLRFETPDAVSPRKLKQGDDKRKLALGFVSLSLTQSGK